VAVVLVGLVLPGSLLYALLVQQEHSQTIGFRVREAPQQEAVNQTENCSVHANGKRKRQNYSHSEAGAFTQLSERVAKILE
jgi:hypothetical protein